MAIGVFVFQYKFTLLTRNNLTQTNLPQIPLTLHVLLVVADNNHIKSKSDKILNGTKSKCNYEFIIYVFIEKIEYAKKKKC